MKKGVLYLDEQSDPELIETATELESKISGNLNFTTPNPSIAELNAARVAFAQAYLESRDGAKSKMLELKIKRKSLKEILTKEVAYVNSIALGDEAIIISAGVKVAKEKEPFGILPAPQDLKVLDGDNEGEVYAKFDKVNGAYSYFVQYYEEGWERDANVNANVLNSVTQPVDDPSGIALAQKMWSGSDVSTKTKIKIAGLTSGKRIWVRVCAVGAEGKGTWSDPATKVVE
ncbi:MAG: fibronectin type III domain-containing protein [Bacteroidales bacterium]|nr:fibronectin type III domain-containing protein [Bacteroidales bacterium]